MGWSLRACLLRIAFSNVLVALNGVGFAIAGLVLSRSPIALDALLLPFSAIFFVYSLDKLNSFDPQDALNDPERTIFVRRWRSALLASAIICFCIGLMVAWSRSWIAGVLFVFPVAVGMLYSIPLLPRRFRFRRLKDVTGVKSLIVSLAWGVGSGLLPLAYLGVIQVSSALLIFLWIASRLFINTVYFDLGDISGDRRAGTRTLAVVLGFSRTRTLLLIANALVGAILLWVTLAGYLPPIAHAANLVTLYAFYYLWAAKTEEGDIGFLCDVVADGEGVIAALLVLLWLALA